jgi:adenylosuccinate synthase
MSDNDAVLSRIAGEILNRLKSPEYFKKTLTALLSAGERLHIFSADDEPQILRDALGKSSIVFEGAQGILLDEWYGFHPYTTWSTCTSENALGMLEPAGSFEPVVIGVLRAFSTRHGAGPFVSECRDFPLRYSGGEHNVSNLWQTSFRLGWFDLVAARYALEADDHITGIAITCLDRLSAEPFGVVGSCETPFGSIERLRVSRKKDLGHQEELGKLLLRSRPTSVSFKNSEHDMKSLERDLGRPFIVFSSGPTWNDKRWAKSPWVKT